MEAAVPKIYSAIAGVMQDIGAVGKNKKNQQQGFLFRGIDDVMNAISPALIKHKVFIVPEILEQIREERQTKAGNNLIYSICKIKFTFFTEDGSFIQATTIGEGMDSGDKATNKAMSIAYKYACFQVFNIPTEEMKDTDPDKESHNTVPGKKETKKTKQETISQGTSQDEREDIGEDKIDAAKINVIKEQLQKTEVDEKNMLSYFGIKKIEEMTTAQFIKAMKKFQITQDKKAGVSNE